MYVPLHFQEISSDAIAALIEDAPLACIVAQTAEKMLNVIVAFGAINGLRATGHGRMADGMVKHFAEAE